MRQSTRGHVPCGLILRNPRRLWSESRDRSTSQREGPCGRAALRDRPKLFAELVPEAILTQAHCDVRAVSPTQLDLRSKIDDDLCSRELRVPSLARLLLALVSTGTRIIQMRQWLVKLGLCAGFGALAFPSSRARGDTGGGNGNNPPCIHYRAEAVLAVAGYNHLVYIGNACAGTAYCDIITSANPNPIDVVVPTSETLAVITYRGSPARIFQVKVTC